MNWYNKYDLDNATSNGLIQCFKIMLKYNEYGQ